MDAQVTVVIPVYDVADYLRHCLDSIIAQTERRWCCVCTDDGSPDRCPEILDGYTRQDARFLIVHQPNRGVAVARNRCLDRVMTPFVTFVDPDDWIEPDHLRRLYTLCRDSDIGVVGWYDHHLHGARSERTACHPNFSGRTESISAPVIYKSGALWNKLISQKLVDKIRFFDGLRFGEDIVFLLLAMAHADSVRFDSSYCGYHYVRRSFSLSHGRSVLETAACYWDDTLALCRTELAGQKPSLLREWLVRAMAGHLISVFRYSDAQRLVESFSTSEGVSIWRLLRQTDSCSEDKALYAGNRFQAWGYGQIFGSLSPKALKTVLFLLWNWAFRIVRKVRSVFEGRR